MTMTRLRQARSFAFVTSLLLVAVAVAGCGGTTDRAATNPGDPAPLAAPATAPAAAQPDNPLAGTAWRLVEFQSMDDARGTTKPADPSLYTMEFHADGAVSMRLNCNRATGSWKAVPSADPSNGQFEFGPLAATRALCPPPSMDELIAAQAQYVRGYMLRDGRLHLSLMADAGIFVWEPVAAGAADSGKAPDTAASASGTIPADVVALIRKEYSSPDMPSRYLSGTADLNGDGRPELLVHVVGPTACGTGGCPTLVFTPGEGDRYTLMSTLTVTRPPIRVSPRSSGGWRNLIVEIGGGGGRSGHAEVAHRGQGYQENPTVPPARRITDLAGAHVVIDEFDSFEAATPLPPD